MRDSQSLRNDLCEKQDGYRKYDREYPQRFRAESVLIGRTCYRGANRMRDGISDENGGDWHVDLALKLLQKLPGPFALLGERLDLCVIDG